MAETINIYGRLYALQDPTRLSLCRLLIAAHPLSYSVVGCH